MLRCPRCSTTVARPTKGSPTCPNCGFGAKGKAAKPSAVAAATIPAMAVTPRPTAVGAGGGQPQATMAHARPRGHNGPIPGRLRDIPVGKAVLLGILTLGIYVMVLSFKSSGDLHRMAGGWPHWKLFFWLGFIPYAGAIFWIVLYFKNNKQSNGHRRQRGLPESYVPFILSLIPIVNIASPFLWASHYNELASRT